MCSDHGPDPPERAETERTRFAWQRTRLARQRTVLASLWPSRPDTTAPQLADESSEDTRTYLAWQRTWLAQERTHLAWVRTTMNVVGLGLAIIKFGPLSGFEAIAAGLLVVVAGVAALAYSTRRYHQHTQLKANRRGPAIAGATLVATVLTAGLLLVHGHSHHHPHEHPHTAHLPGERPNTAHHRLHDPTAPTPPRSTA